MHKKGLFSQDFDCLNDGKKGAKKAFNQYDYEYYILLIKIGFRAVRHKFWISRAANITMSIG